MWSVTDSLHHDTVVMCSGAASYDVGHPHNSHLLYCYFYRLLHHYVSWDVLYIRQGTVSTATIGTTIQDNKGLQSVKNRSGTWKIWPINFTFGCDTIFSEECVASMFSVTKRYQGKC